MDKSLVNILPNFAIINLINLFRRVDDFDLTYNFRKATTTYLGKVPVPDVGPHTLFLGVFGTMNVIAKMVSYISSWYINRELKSLYSGIDYLICHVG